MDEKDVRIKNLENQVDELKDYIKDFEKRVSLLEKNTGISEEQIKMIYKILNEIKSSITSIANKLDTLEQEPGKEAKQVKASVIASFLSAIAGIAAGLLFRK